MGYNTIVLVRNDALSNIKRDPERFVSGLDEAIGGRARWREGAQSVGAGGHANVAEVCPPHHADDPRFYASTGNTILECDRANLSHLQELVERSDFTKNWVESSLRRMRDEADKMLELLNLKG